MKHIIVSILLLIVLSSCTIPTGDVVVDNDVKIGSTLALTGGYADFGINQLRGMELAVDDVNNNGGINGKKLVLVVEDNKGDAKEAVTTVRQMMDIRKVGIVWSSFTHITTAIKDVVLDNNGFLFYSSTYAPIARSSAYAFRDFFDVEDAGVAIVNAVASFGKNRIAYIGENSDLCELHREAFEKEADKLKVEIVAKEIFPTDIQDFRTILLKIMEKDPDSLMTCTWRHNHLFMKDLKELGFIDKQTFQMLGPLLPIANEEGMMKLFSENNAVSTWYGFGGDSANLKVQEFVDRYEDVYGETPRADAVYSYDDIIILSEAMKMCNNLDRDCLSEQLLNLKIDGIGGSLYFDKDGVSKREVLFIQAINNEWKEIIIQQ